MSVSVSLGGVAYTLPVTGEVNWGDLVTAYLQALATRIGTAVSFGAGSSGTGTNTFFLRPAYDSSTATALELSWPVPQAGKLSQLRYRTGTAHTTGDLVVTVRKNGSDTALTCTAASTVATAQNLTNSVTVAAGDLISVKFTTAAASVAALNMYAHLMLTPS